MKDPIRCTNNIFRLSDLFCLIRFCIASALACSTNVIRVIRPTNTIRPLFRQFQVGEPRGRIDIIGIPRASQYIIEISKIPINIEFPGSVVEALLDHELSPSGVAAASNKNETTPQRVVCGQPLESDGDLAEDVDKEVAIIETLLTIKFDIWVTVMCVTLVQPNNSQSKLTPHILHRSTPTV